MIRQRFVVVGLAPARTDWFGQLAQWSTNGVVPIEFIKCLSAEELSLRIEHGQGYSAALIDAHSNAINGALLEVARQHKVTVICIGEPPQGLDALKLPDQFTPDQLTELLAVHARQQRDEVSDVQIRNAAPTGAQETGRMVSVLGTGGTGTSTISAALAQTLASRPGGTGNVVLCDFSRRSAQAFLHDTLDLSPSIHEAMDLAKNKGLSSQEVRNKTFYIPQRGYSLLIGLRNSTAWTTFTRFQCEELLTSIRNAYEFAVCDLDSDIDGHKQSGSHDIEDRHNLTRVSVMQSSALVVTGRATAVGIHALASLVGELQQSDVHLPRIQPVLVAPKSFGGKKSFAMTLQAATGLHETDLADPIFIPAFDADATHQQVHRFPDNVIATLRPFIDELGVSGESEFLPAKVQAGELGHWNEGSASA